MPSNICIDKSQESNVEQLNRTRALFYAIESENVTLVERLLENGCNVNIKKETLQTPLQVASGKGNFQIVKLLLDYDAEINVEDDFQQTALHKALWNGHATIVELLLSKGADICEKAPKKIGIYCDIYSPLGIAIKKGSLSMVRILLKYGADPNIQCWSKHYPLERASVSGKVEIVKRLLEHGANVNAANDIGG